MKSNNIEVSEKLFIEQLKDIVSASRKLACSAINIAQVRQNWLIGQRLVEQEQHGQARAAYGARVIELASKALTEEFGRGFSPRSLWKFKQFYLEFKDLQILPMASAEFSEAILPTPSAVSTHLLSWSHYERLMRVADADARKWYQREAAEQMWSHATLDRNINTLYYQRLLASQAQAEVEEEMKQKTSVYQRNKLEFIKSPSVLEFLGLPAAQGYTESSLEQAIIEQLIRTETSNFYIDLVFYNYILKCFVIVELKTHELTHQDIGQLDMYVRMYDDLKKSDSDNPTIGILLCTETDKTIARYSVLNENKQIFASKYMPYLPTEKELEEEIMRQKALLRMCKDNEDSVIG